MEDELSGWVRFENTTPDGLKVAPLTDRAHRLWFNAICYCSRARSSGKVPAALILNLSPTANAKAVGELLSAGLLERPDEKMYLVHDYLDYNPSRERIEEMREGNRDRVARHREKRDGNALQETPSNALQENYPRVRDRTGPTPEVVRLSERLADHIRRNDPKATPDPTSERWLTDMRLLVQDRDGDVGEVERVINWCQADDFWRSNILSPGKLRKQFTQLLLKAKAPVALVAHNSPGLRLVDPQQAENNRLGQERREKRLAEIRAEIEAEGRPA